VIPLKLWFFLTGFLLTSASIISSISLKILTRKKLQLGEEMLAPILAICRHLHRPKVILKMILLSSRRIMKKFKDFNY
jgi:hypothetical protein